MQVQLTRPELERFIAQQVEAGHFPSAQAAIEAAIEQMMLAGDEFELSDEDVEAINEAEDQIDRGETVDFDTFAAEMRKRHTSH
jgi:Arc/MetJ-type ribon-helix-helix transcriptional regulator